MRAVLTYHSIDDSGSAISVTREAFARHVRWLASGRVRVVPLEELASVPSDQHAVAITFDDAFENFETEAAPTLLEHDLPVTLFVVTDRVGATNAWHGGSTAGVPTMPLLGWRALNRLASAGISLGAHSRTHADLTELQLGALEDEMAGSAERLRQEVGVAPLSFAYPYGRVNAAAAQCAASTFGWAVTTEFRTLDNVEDRWLLPRLDMYYMQVSGSLEAWGTRAFTRRITIRRGLRSLRSLMTSPAYPALARSGNG